MWPNCCHKCSNLFRTLSFLRSEKNLAWLNPLGAEISASLAHHAVLRMYGGSVSERDSDEEADDADSERHGAQMHYLYYFGDSQVFFEHVMPGASANSHGLRFLYRRRAQADQ